MQTQQSLCVNLLASFEHCNHKVTPHLQLFKGLLLQFIMHCCEVRGLERKSIRFIAQYLPSCNTVVSSVKPVQSGRDFLSTIQRSLEVISSHSPEQQTTFYKLLTEAEL